MKKTLIALIATAATLSGTAAYAQTNTQDAAGTGYIGAGVVGSRYDFDTAGAGAVSGDNHSGTKAGGKIYGGYNIDSTWQWKPATPTSASAATTTPRAGSRWPEHRRALVLRGR
jgi:hypothetical protein